LSKHFAKNFGKRKIKKIKLILPNYKYNNNYS